MASLANPPSTPMRRSCKYCRARKVRCSGQSICDLCRQKGKGCVYDAESMRGRRKASVSQSNLMRAEWDLLQLVCDESRPRTDYATNSHELERIFQHNMKMRPVAPDAAIAGEPRTGEALLFSLAPEMLEMLLVQFGHLGLQAEGHQARFFATCLAHDTTLSMFEAANNRNSSNPLASIDSEWTRQLIDIGFSIHPFSVLVSKTLWLKSIKDGVYDQALLAILLSHAMATLVIHVPESNCASLLLQSSELAEWSIAQVCALAVKDMDISTAQTLLLLGWHQLQRSQARRALSYIQLAAQAIGHLRRCRREAPNTGSYRRQINGFQVVDVEDEVLQNMDSITHSMRLWILMQTDDGHSPAERLTESTIPASFPPIDELSSCMIALDIASNHVSTIRAQATIVRLLWLLSHLTATLSQVYVLAHSYSQTSRSEEKVPSQTRHLHQLRQLAGNGIDKESLCGRIHLCLREALGTMQQQQRQSSRSLLAIVEVTYLTIMIHMLFPHGPCGSWALTGAVLGDFLTEAGSLLATICSFTRDHPSLQADAAGCFTTAAQVFALGLEIAVRAMQDIYARRWTGSTTEQDLIAANSAGLLELLRQMHQIAESEILTQTKRVDSLRYKLHAIPVDANAAACIGTPNGLEPHSQTPHPTEEFLLQLASWDAPDLAGLVSAPFFPDAV